MKRYDWLILMAFLAGVSVSFYGCSSDDESSAEVSPLDAAVDANQAPPESDASVAPPTLETSQPSFRIAQLAPGQAIDRTIEITNAGDADIELTQFDLEVTGGTAELLYGARQVIGIARDGADLFESEGRYPVILSPDITLPLTLAFVAGDSPPGGSLTISGSFDGSPLTVPIEVISSVGQIDATPTELNFGRVRNMTELTEMIQIVNAGADTLVISDITKTSNIYFHVELDGGDPTIEPALYFDPDGDGVPGLAPGSSIDVSVRFAPTQEGRQESTLVIDTNDPVTPELRIPLLGNPIEGCVDVSHETLEWIGTVREITQSPVVSISNCGDQALTIDSLGLLAGSSQNFEFVPLENVPDTFPHEMPPMAPTMTFAVNYGPPDARRYRGNIELLTNDPARHTVIIPLQAESMCMADGDCAEGYRCDMGRCLEIEQMP